MQSFGRKSEGAKMAAKHISENTGGGLRGLSLRANYTGRMTPAC
jgi:hypothetical protein